MRRTMETRAARRTSVTAFAALSAVMGCTGEPDMGDAPAAVSAPVAPEPAATAQAGKPEPVSAAMAGQHEEAWNITLVAHHNLDGRSAYHPILHRYGDRVILFVGHHAGEAVNSLTGELETNGMSILDVTDPANPTLLRHVPPNGAAGFTQHVQVCDGSELPSADPDRVYLIRTSGNLGAEMYDVTNPLEPLFMSTIYETGRTDDGRQQTHKIQWDCASGIAYLNGTPEGWRVPRVLQLFDIADPEQPRHIRDFALNGSQPGATGARGTPLHQPYASGNRVYLGYGASADGVMQILDRDKLVNGDPAAQDRYAPTPENLLYPQIARLDLPSYYGAHTAKPIYDVEIADYADNAEHRTLDLVLLVSEETTNECASDRDIMALIDITQEDKPFPISTFQVPEEPGDFCHRGVRFGPHSPQDAVHPAFQKKMVMLAYFNAGVRAIDIRDPFHPVEVGYYIPAMTENTFEMCDDVNGEEICGRQIQTNNVNLDDRGYIYALDRAGTGLHILALTGQARDVVGIDYGAQSP